MGGIGVVVRKNSSDGLVMIERVMGKMEYLYEENGVLNGL